MIFTITGKVKPYVRMTQRSKWVRFDAQEYLSSQYAMAAQLKQQADERGYEMLAERTPLFVTIRFTMPTRLHNQDLDNQGKAVLDAMQGIVFKNDCWVDKMNFSRSLGDEFHAEIVVGELADEY